MRDRLSITDRPELVLGLATFAIHLWANGSYGYFRDELYFIVCGRHLAWGYTDQPPLTPLLASASDTVFHSLRGLRLVPAIACAATVALTAHTARLLGGGLYARWLAGLAVLGGGALQLFGVIFTTDSLQPLAWLSIAICIIKAERDDDPRWWLAAGLIGGVAFLAKYTVALYLASLGLGLLATPERRLLARWEPWAAALIALVDRRPEPDLAGGERLAVHHPHRRPGGAKEHSAVAGLVSPAGDFRPSGRPRPHCGSQGSPLSLSGVASRICGGSRSAGSCSSPPR